MFKLKPDQEDGVGGYVCDRIFIPGSHCVSLATQTGEVAYTDIPDGLAPGMPINPNLSVMYHGAWPIEKGKYFVHFNIVKIQNILSIL